MTRIIEGVLDFQKNVHDQKRELFQQLGHGQKPLALFITCSDSRISPGLLSQTQPGELFILRNAGNIVPPYNEGAWAEAGTIEYAVVQLKVRDIILCGHARCGAMHGLLEPAALATMPTVAGWLRHAREVLPRVQAAGDLPEDVKLDLAIKQNVLVQMEHLRTHPSVAQALDARVLRLHGWVYDFVHGNVLAYDAPTGEFVAVESAFRQTLLEHSSKEEPRTEWDVQI